MAPNMLELNGHRNTPTANGETSRFRSVPNGGIDYEASSNEDEDRRPSSAPDQGDQSASAQARDRNRIDKSGRPNKPLLHRSKSEFGPRPTDDTEHIEDVISEWGTRHGFEDHYQSEHIISQLANVCVLFSQPFLVLSLLGMLLLGSSSNLVQ
jgi:regulator-associated protein of mTOR